MNKMKKHVSVKGLLRIIRGQFDKVPENILRQNGISIVDCLMSGLAVFMLKSPSLLDFDEKRKDSIVCHNMKELYRVKNTPCDTYLSERLDEIDHKSLRGRLHGCLLRCKEAKF